MVVFALKNCICRSKIAPCLALFFSIQNFSRKMLDVRKCWKTRYSGGPIYALARRFFASIFALVFRFWGFADNFKQFWCFDYGPFLTSSCFEEKSIFMQPLGGTFRHNIHHCFPVNHKIKAAIFLHVFPIGDFFIKFSYLFRRGHSLWTIGLKNTTWLK